MILAVAVLTLLLTSACVEKNSTGPMPQKEIGLQLYSVRSKIGKGEEMATRLPELLDTLAAMGYTSVEAANYVDGRFYGMTPANFRTALEDRGMKALSSHTTRALTEEELASGDFTEAMKWWDQCIADHKAAGMEYIVTPYMNISSLKDLDIYCRYFNEIGKRCNENGIKYGYHNHSHDFKKIDDQVILDYMIENTDPENVFYQLDVYWTVMGQASPVDYFKRYPGRFKLLHIKDRAEVGQSGMVGYDAIFDNAGTAGVENVIIEAEGSSFGDILGTVKQSIEYLQKAPFVPATYSRR